MEQKSHFPDTPNFVASISSDQEVDLAALNASNIHESVQSFEPSEPMLTIKKVEFQKDEDNKKDLLL